MKKLIVFLTIFGMIAVVATSTMIHVSNERMIHEETQTSTLTEPKTPTEKVEKTNTVQESNISAEIVEKTNTVQDSKEKTLDFYTTFDENDLVIEEKKETYPNATEGISYPQIHGLKNKEVENKINKDMEEKAKSFYSSLVKADRTDYHFTFYKYEYANFANVISLQCWGSYRDSTSQYSKGESLYLNYELVNGNEIKLEDLFTKNTDIAVIANIGLTKAIENDELYRGFATGGDGYYGTPYFDKQKGIWMVSHYRYNEKTMKDEETIEEYVPLYTEYEKKKMVDRFVDNPNKMFHFNSSEVTFYMDDIPCRILFEELADKLVIYDKYLTKESIFENDGIGIDNILVCSPYNFLPKGVFHKAEFESENFFYDISFSHWSSELMENTEEERRLSKEKVEEIQNRLISQAKLKLAEYEKMARENPEKAYIVVIGLNARVELNSWGIETEKSVLETMDISLITCDKVNRKEVWAKVFPHLRYYHLGFYGGITSYLYNIEDLEETGATMTKDKVENRYVVE